MCLKDFCSGVQDSWLFSGPSCEAPYIAVTLQNEENNVNNNIPPSYLSCEHL